MFYREMEKSYVNPLYVEILTTILDDSKYTSAPFQKYKTIFTH